MKKKYLSVVSFALVVLFSSVCFAQIVIIVNLKNPLDTMTKNELAAIYRLKQSNWPTGEKISAANLPPADPARVKFSGTVLNTSAQIMEGQYVKLALSGASVNIPQVLKSTEQIINFINNNPGAIAYLEAKDVDRSKVKVLTIDGKEQME